MSVSIRPENCEYRVEGNAGIVVRLVEEGMVLKLKKQENVSKVNPSAEEVFKEMQSEVKAVNYVLKPLLGESFVHTPLLVFLKADEIKVLNAAITRFRPANRRHKSVKEEDTYAYLLPDFCSLPPSLKLMPTKGSVLSIEIKPKQGFMKEVSLPSSFSTPPFPMCRFCLMQIYKLKRGTVSSKSGYCPVDLFSGCYNRMHHAVKMLVKTPQNNLRIFQNQKLVYSEEIRDNLLELLSDFTSSEQHRALDILCDLIVQALIKPFPGEMEKSPIFYRKNLLEDCVNAHAVYCEHDIHHELPHHCVLERVLNCQTLDNLNIADLYQLYDQVKEKNESYPDYSIGCYSRSQIPPYTGELKRNPNETDYEYASRKVWEFLLALTMKDCSIMITLQSLTSISSNSARAQNIISDNHGNFYVFSVSVIDLDSKSLNKVEKVYNDLTFMLENLVYEK